MTHPGVGPITSLATEVFLGDPQRFADGKAIARYVGMIPGEYYQEAGDPLVDHDEIDYQEFCRPPSSAEEFE
jgi:hypothetical protein